MPGMMNRFWLSGFVSLLFASSFSPAFVEGGGAAVDYAPGDTRLLTYSPFCQALTVAYSKPSVNIGPSVLYSLNVEPMLTNVDSFNFHRFDILNNSRTCYEWDLHFYRESELQVSACINGNGSAMYYLIKGKDGFNDWKFHSQMNSVVNSFKIDSTCSRKYFEITEEDQYFFVFQMIESEIQVVNITMDISVNRSGYSVNNEVQFIEKRRFTATSSGSVQIPLNHGSFVLLFYGNSSESPEYWNNIASQLATDITCEPRIWLYAVITVGAVLALLLCIVCIACCICAVRHCKKRRSSELNPLLRDWDDVNTDIQKYHPYVDRGGKLDNLTELAIAAPDASNPHIAQFKEDIKSPSFQDNYLSSASPKFSTFKP